MTSQEALAVARAAASSTGTLADRDDPIGRQPGQRVTVTPDDTGRDPVVGELVASGVDEITIKRNDPAVGEVSVAFSACRLCRHAGLDAAARAKSGITTLRVLSLAS
jgi:hypothetical protein